MATDRLGDMRLFAQAAALGSLSAAGRKLALSPAAASARLVKLEAALNTRLFDRTTRQLRLTDEGRVYLQHCLIALRAIDDAEAVLQDGNHGVRGKVHISASADFGRNLLSQWLEEFSSNYPEINIALTLSDSVANLVQDDIDIAIRFGKPMVLFNPYGVDMGTSGLLLQAQSREEIFVDKLGAFVLRPNRINSRD